MYGRSFSVAFKRIRSVRTLPFLSSFPTSTQHRFYADDRTVAPNLRGHQVSYCVLFPEFPADDSRSAEFNNKLFSAPLPPFNALEEFDMKEALFAALRAIFEFSIWYDDHELKFKEPGFKKTFKSVVEPILRELTKSRYAMSIVCHTLASTQMDFLTIRELERTQRLYLTSVTDIRYSLELYKVMKELHADPRSHNKWERGVIRLFVNEGHLNGCDLTQLEVEGMLRWSKDYVAAKAQYFTNIASFSEQYEKSIEDKVEWDDAPDCVLSMFATGEDVTEGPWKVKVNPETYVPLMKYCANRTRRYAMWRYWNMKAGFTSLSLNNSLNIEEMRLAKHDMARSLGYPTHLDTTLRLKMANSEMTIKEFLFTLKSRMKTRFARKYQELCAYAKLNDRMLDPILKPWDMYFYSRKEALSSNMIKASALRDYFPASIFLHNFLTFLSRLLGFTIEDVTVSTQTLFPEIEVLKFSDEATGRVLGHMYVDIYSRLKKNGHSGITCPRSRCDIPGAEATPIVFLNFNFPRSEEGAKPVCLSWEELEEVTRALAEGLSSLLSESPYPEVSGQNGMQIDTVTFFPNFLEQLLHQPKVLSGLSCHYRTGDRLKEEDARITSQTFMESNFYEVYRRIFLSEFDYWNWAGMVPFWKDLYINLWGEYFPFPLEAEDDFPCSFTPIYTEKSMGNFYGEIWSKMMAIDVMEKFQKECDDFADRDAVAVLGRKLRKDIVSVGGAVGFRELFTTFMGRDPSVEPFLKFYGAVEELRLGDRLKHIGETARTKIEDGKGQKRIDQAASKAIEQ